MSTQHHREREEKTRPSFPLPRRAQVATTVFGLESPRPDASAWKGTTAATIAESTLSPPPVSPSSLIVGLSNRHLGHETRSAVPGDGGPASLQKRVSLTKIGRSFPLPRLFLLVPSSSHDRPAESIITFLDSSRRRTMPRREEALSPSPRRGRPTDDRRSRRQRRAAYSKRIDSCAGGAFNHLPCR